MNPLRYLPPFWGNWSAGDLLDWAKPGRCAEPDEGERDNPAIRDLTPIESLEKALAEKGRELHDLRNHDRLEHWDPSIWGWFGDPKKYKPTKKNDARRALPYGKRTAAKTTAACIHTMDVKVGWRRCLGMPVHLAVDDYADAVLCNDLLSLVAAAHAYNSFSFSLEISGHSDATEDQIDTARLLLVYARDEIRRRRRLEGADNDRIAIGTHFMATNKRSMKDPGQKIYKAVNQYAMAELGYRMGPVVGSGQMPPARWG